MNTPVSEEHITVFSNYLFNPEAVWACFDVGDLVRFNRQLGLLSISTAYRIEAIDCRDEYHFRLRLSYVGRPQRIPLIVDRFDVYMGEMRHL